MRTVASALVLGFLCQLAACTSGDGAAGDSGAGRCPPEASDLGTSLVVTDVRGEARYGRIRGSAEVTEPPIDGKADGGVGASLTLTLDDGSVATIDSDFTLPLPIAAGDRVWLDAEIFQSYPSTVWSVGVVRTSPGGQLLYGFATGPLELIAAEPFTNAGLTIRATDACSVVPGLCWGVIHQEIRYASDRDAVTLFGNEQGSIDIGGQELRIRQARAYATDLKYATGSCSDAVPFGIGFAFAATSRSEPDDDAGS